MKILKAMQLIKCSVISLWISLGCIQSFVLLPNGIVSRPVGCNAPRNARVYSKAAISTIPEALLTGVMDDGICILKDITSDAIAFYRHEHEVNGYLTDVTTSVTMHSISNIIGQLAISDVKIPSSTEPKSLDAGLLTRFALVGFVDGSFAHYWYPMLEAFIPGSSVMDVMEKMVADTAIFSTSSTTFYLLVSNLEKGLTLESLTEGWESLKQEFQQILFGGECFWVPANGIIYGLVPLEFRNLGDCVAIVLYTIGLSIWELQKNAAKEDASNI